MLRINKISSHLTFPSTDITYTFTDHIAIITLNRPTRGNGITLAMQELYFDLLDKANADPNVGCIIVTGNGKMFCVGADKDSLTDITRKGDDGQSRAAFGFKRDVSQIQTLELDKPVICVVNGSCAGLGFVLATMCDVRFAVAGAKFTTSFAKRGLIAEHGVNWVLPRIVGLANAADLLLSSRVVLAEEALGMGLVNRVYPTQQVCMQEAMTYAKEMIRMCSPAAISEIKRQLYSNSGSGSPREEADRAKALMIKSFKHPDFEQGVLSLVERKDPKFKGLAAGYIREL